MYVRQVPDLSRMNSGRIMILTLLTSTLPPHLAPTQEFRQVTLAFTLVLLFIIKDKTVDVRIT